MQIVNSNQTNANLKYIFRGENLIVDNKSIVLDLEEVVSVKEQDRIVIDYPMFTKAQLLSAIKDDLTNSYVTKLGTLERWLSEGVDAKVLQFGAKSWQKGKVRLKISLEFCPDNPQPEEVAASNETDATQSESPLDDLRQQINQEIQSQN
jgi:hypothetical protein